jgi:hypothetical protein
MTIVRILTGLSQLTWTCAMAPLESRRVRYATQAIPWPIGSAPCAATATTDVPCGKR